VSRPISSAAPLDGRLLTVPQDFVKILDRGLAVASIAKRHERGRGHILGEEACRALLLLNVRQGAGSLGLDACAREPVR
jgi:hypothetical protein